MAVFIKFYDEDTSLSNLPAEVIRRIILMDKEDFSYTANELKLISPAWYNMVTDLQDSGELPQLEPTIERVYISAAVPRDDWRVEMHALLRQGWARLIEADKKSQWLRPRRGTHYEEGVFEVECEYSLIATRYNLWNILIGVGSTALVIATAVCYFFPQYGFILLTVTIVGIAAASLAIWERNDEKVTQGRFTRFFSPFSRIGTLVLEDFGSTHHEQRLSAALMKVL
ncbi:hypothetical protein PMAYCL1PPCAC_21285 [Pristionchus mayeri]|uniref:Uncharacterized protein n=1 Tax=Pristionchus mayeri TaxID=1317129 RepID=A0AAN5I4I2_9BILA|nr:hypothetical protein PMAYCL1PPCAC_21285 [Pristionchus mayeri]